MSGGRAVREADRDAAAGALRSAAATIARGGIVAYPTEAVFGLGCDPRNEHAVRRLLRIKGRPADKGLILIAATAAQIEPFLAPLEPALWARCAASWPGPLTWVLPARPALSRLLTGAHDGLAVRVTAHPLAAALCRACGHALVSTSANRAQHAPARNAQAVRTEFGAEVDFVLDGETSGRTRPTPIRHALSGARLRV